MSKLLKNFFHRDRFLTRRWGLLSNPSYFARRGIFKQISKIAPSMNGEIMDFGCGSKPYQNLFTSSTSYIGVDIEVSGHPDHDSLVDVYYDGVNLPFENMKFDCAVSFEVFEHIFNLPEIIAEIARVLKPGGKLLCSVPFAWPEHEQPYDFARYTSFGIRHLINNSGFEVEKVIKTNTTVRALGQIFIDYLSNILLKNGGLIGRLTRIIILPIMNMTTLIIDAILPSRQEYYSNLVILATRRDC